jgi:hypothetical protein
MTGTEFVAQLIAENEELLARIDAPAESRPSERSDPQSFDTLFCSEIARARKGLRGAGSAMIFHS